MKVFLLAVCIAVISLSDALRIRPPPVCTKPTPDGCDKTEACRKCFVGQKCELACGTCNPICKGICKPCQLAKCSLGFECIANLKKCTANCCKKNCNIKSVCAATTCPYGQVATPNKCACKCECKPGIPKCLKGCPKIYRPVCGTDGKTYANNCILQIAICKSNGKIRKRSNGPCSCNRLCPWIYRPVCASNGRTYTNACLFQIAKCQSYGRLRKVSNGRCRKFCPVKNPCQNAVCPSRTKCVPRFSECAYSCQPIICPILQCIQPACDARPCGSQKCIDDFCPGSCVFACLNSRCNGRCPKIYKPVCGTDGKTYGNHCQLKFARCQSAGRIRLKSKGVCPPRKCPDVCILLSKPVCGSDGKTYSNSCFLGIASCKSGGKIKQVGEGPCPKTH